MVVGNTVQIIRGKYKWCIGTIISINDFVALIEIDNELTASCDLTDVELL